MGKYYEAFCLLAGNSIGFLIARNKFQDEKITRTFVVKNFKLNSGIQTAGINP